MNYCLPYRLWTWSYSPSVQLLWARDVPLPVPCNGLFTAGGLEVAAVPRGERQSRSWRGKVGGRVRSFQQGRENLWSRFVCGFAIGAVLLRATSRPNSLLQSSGWRGQGTMFCKSSDGAFRTEVIRPQLFLNEGLH